MSGSKRHYHDAPSPTLHFLGTNDRLFRIIAALDDYVRLEMLHEVQRRVFGEYYDEIDALETCQHIRAFGVAPHRTRRAFEAAYGFIAVDAHDQRVCAFARGGEKIDVPRVKQIEYTIRERYPTLSSRSPPLGLRPRCNLCRGMPRLQSLLTAKGWKCSTFSFFSGSLMTSS